MRSIFLFLLFVCFAFPAQAVDTECEMFDDPAIDASLTWMSIDLTDGFSGINGCSPFFTVDGFRLEDATYAQNVGRCVIKIGATEYAFSSLAYAGQFFQLFLSDSVFDPSGQKLSEVWCEDGNGIKGTMVSSIPTMVPVSEAPGVPLQQAP